MQTRDLYAVLGVANTATQDEIKAAYRRLSRANHPDQVGKAGHARQAELNAAYDVLGDAAKRAEYDRPLFGALLDVADQTLDEVTKTAQNRIAQAVPTTWGRFGDALRSGGGAVVKAAAEEIRERARRGLVR